MGTKTTDKLEGGSSGSVLYLDTNVPVKIKNLTITGGMGTSVSSTLYGGGIYINKGSVELTTGVVVDGNTADVGGGVYLADGTLYLNDTAVVGKPLTALGANPTCAGTTSETYANMATEKGGGIAINAGTLWLGYRPPVQGESQAQAKDTSGGVIYNLVTSTGATQGGGIDNYNGIINIVRGVVSYNYASGTGTGSNDVGSGGGISTTKTLALQGNAEISHNESAYGGAVYIGNGGSFTMSAGTITENASKKQHTKWGDGGGIAIGGGGNFYMSGGTVSSNTAEGKGGAVYHTGTTFEISGSTATIPKGDNEKNNIQLETTSQKIKITGSTNSGDGEIAITPARWQRGDQIFADGSTTSYFSKFTLTDSEWSIVSYTVGTNTTGRIDAPLYVAGTTAQTISEVSYGAGKTPANGGLGTKAKPYSTIDDAVAQCWHGPNDTVTNTGRTITIVGTVIGGHTISSSITTSANATAITLAGVNTDATLNGGFSSGSSHEGRPLTITSAVPIIIQNLTIKGGYTTDGGGIYVSAEGAKLTLTTGAKVTGNTVTNGSGGGGGIYIAGTSTSKANLIMNSNAQIYGNTARNSTAAVKGGGVYLSYANLCMAGTAIIGAHQSGTAYAQNTSNQYSNFAYSTGGGVYCDKNSSVWLGYSEAASDKTSDLSAGYGIIYNYSTSGGGGLYCLGQVHMASGSVSNNGVTSVGGGGIYLYSDANGTASMEMSGGTLSYNNGANGNGGAICNPGSGTISLSGTTTTLAGNFVSGITSYGGAIYNKGTIYMSDSAVIGDSSQTSPADSSNKSNSAPYGGGIYNGGNIYLGYKPPLSTAPTVPVPDDNFSGGIYYNYASKYGGGIENFYSTSRLYFYKGTIKCNRAADTGGGIYADSGTSFMTGGSIENNIAAKGGGVSIGSEALFRIENASGATTSGTISSNEATTSGGAVYMNGCKSANNYGLLISGAASIPKGTDNKNDIYINGSEGVACRPIINGLLTDSEIILLSGNSRLYSEGYFALNVSNAAYSSSYAKFDVKPNNGQEWTLLDVSASLCAKMATATRMTSSNISSFTPVEGQSYNFVMDSTVDYDALNAFFRQMCDRSTNTNYIGESTLDLSKTSLTKVNGGNITKDNYLTQNITKVILPSTLPVSGIDTLNNYGITWAFAKVKEYVVPSDSAYLCTEDGVLYNKDKTILVKYPAQKTGASFTVPDSVQKLSNNAFGCASNLTSVSLNNVSTLGNFAFYKSYISSITIPTSITVISEECFNTCTNLQSVYFSGNSVTELKDNAFAGCERLKTITLPSSLQTIGIYAFREAFRVNATTMAIPSSVKLIKKEAFQSASQLTLTFDSTSGWKKSSSENGTYEDVDPSDMTSANVISGSLKNVYLKRN